VASDPFSDLSPHEAVSLVEIADAPDLDVEDVPGSDVSRLLSLGLVEQRGVTLGLTAKGIHTVARLRRGY
jgi:hypothetical protein